ncbi:hypothetical protein KSC_039580 [Ktedonobacter sp. SOSP1-52]|nr:hypothetical protein KSC_039580 [Ktedonobacter sp. SOSP1-52]
MQKHEVRDMRGKWLIICHAYPLPLRIAGANGLPRQRNLPNLREVESPGTHLLYLEKEHVNCYGVG